jgi:hypothetical protein
VLINQAYRILSDANLREQYDRARRQFTEEEPVRSLKSEGRSRHSETQYVICPACGRRNRLAAGVAREKAMCGACHARLFPRSSRSSGVQRVLGDNHLRLSETLYEDLRIKGEVELLVEKLPRGGKITCRRCRRVWTALVRGPVHKRCPACGATDWNAFRLFKCRLCGHEFTTPSLKRDPYLLFPNCPACNKPRWHAGKESGILSGLFKFIKAKG